MRKIIQFKPMLLALSICALGGGVGLASVQVQAAGTAAPVTQVQPEPSPKSTEPVTRVQLGENISVNRGDRIVCKQEPILGTRLKGLRTCRTANEWRRVARGFQQKLKDANDRGGAVYSGN